MCHGGRCQERRVVRRREARATTRGSEARRRWEPVARPRTSRLADRSARRPKRGKEPSARERDGGGARTHRKDSAAPLVGRARRYTLTALDIAASGRGPQLVLREPVWAVDVLRTPVPFFWVNACTPLPMVPRTRLHERKGGTNKQVCLRSLVTATPRDAAMPSFDQQVSSRARDAVSVAARSMPAAAASAPCAAVSEPSRLGVKSKAGTTTPICDAERFFAERFADASRAPLADAGTNGASSPASATTTGATAAVDAATRLRALLERAAADARALGCANRDPQPRTRRGRVVGDGGIGRTRRATPGRRSRACDMREDAERDRARSRTAARVRRVARDARETG